MSGDDYHGVKTLLSQIAVGPLSTLTGLSETIVDQVNVGVVVSADGGDAGIAGFGTILNIEQYKKVPAMASVKSFLSELCKKIPKKAKLINAMLSGDSGATTGLMLKERLVNFPPELSPNMHKVLIEDVQWSTTSEFVPDEGEKSEFYEFDYLLFLAPYEIESGGRVSAEGEEGGGEEPVGMAMKKKRKLDKKNAEASRMYLHWEDEVLIERALFSHSWQNSAKPIVYRANKKYQSYNILYALRYSDYVELSARLSEVAV